MKGIEARHGRLHCNECAIIVQAEVQLLRAGGDSNRVGDAWKARHDQALEQRARLAELRALTAPDAVELLETLRLAVSVEPDSDQREALAAFNASHPDHAEGLFIEGCHRLDRDDESGLQLLEAAMKLVS